MAKPIVIAKPPFWRNKIFPWGWQWIFDMDLKEGEIIKADGYSRPFDGSGTVYRVTPVPKDNDGGDFVNLGNGEVCDLINR